MRALVFLIAATAVAQTLPWIDSGELFGGERTRAIVTLPPQKIAEAAEQWGQTGDITVIAVRRAAA